MRACVPTNDETGLDAEKSDHFGRAPFYTIVDTETGEIEIVPNESDHRGGSKLPPTFVADLDVDVVLVDNVGERGMKLFDEHGIDVYQSPDSTVDAVIDGFQAGTLDQLTLADAHSHSHDHDHEHDHDHDHSHGHEHEHDHDHEH
ncbi:MAG: NifB/NifX family molybdenum-iron cluster-binding protein [Halanaeroarchaeum sp.]